MLAEFRQVQFIFSNQRSHTGAALGRGDGYAVDIRVLNSGECADRFRNLARGNILALPAEGIADAVDKIEITLLILAHQVAGTNPSVSRLKHIAQDLAL